MALAAHHFCFALHNRGHRSAPLRSVPLPAQTPRMKISCRPSQPIHLGTLGRNLVVCGRIEAYDLPTVESGGKRLRRSSSPSAHGSNWARSISTATLVCRAWIGTSKEVLGLSQMTPAIPRSRPRTTSISCPWIWYPMRSSERSASHSFPSNRI